MQNIIGSTDVQLYRLIENDANAIHKHLNHVKISDTYPVNFPFTIQDAMAYVDREIKCRKVGTRLAFSIRIKGEFVGVCALYDIKKTVGKAKLYYWIVVEYWNKGIASKALKKLLNFSKDELQITHLETGVLERNIPSIKVLEKNDFLVKKIFTNSSEYHEKFKGERIVEMKKSL